MGKRGKAVGLILSIVILGASTAGAGTGRLRFCPEIGKKQTVQITSHMATTPASPPAGDVTERHWVLTLELEPLEAASDGTVTIKVTVLRVRHKLYWVRKTGEHPMIDLDSADETRRDKHEMGICLAPVGESFTVVVSARGRAWRVDSAAFCRAVARKRMQYEDEAIRRETIRKKEWEYGEKDEEVRRKLMQAGVPKERVYGVKDEATRRRLIQADVAKALKDENTKYGSAAQRQEHYRKDAAECHLYSLGQVRLMLNDVLVPFPDGPVAEGGRWTAPFMMCADGPVELEGTYTLQSLENDTCTIQVRAERTMNDHTIIEPPVPSEYRTRLAGTYQATMKIDRATGALVSKEASVDLAGRTSNYMPNIPATHQTSQIKSRATTTVEVLH